MKTILATFIHDASKQTAMLDLFRDLRENWYHGFSHYPRSVTIGVPTSCFINVISRLRSSVTSIEQDFGAFQGFIKIVQKEHLEAFELTIKH